MTKIEELKQRIALLEKIIRYALPSYLFPPGVIWPSGKPPYMEEPKEIWVAKQ